MRMQFYVEGSEGAGVVRLEVVKSPEVGSEYPSVARVRVSPNAI
jgi:hypothetical protein